MMDVARINELGVEASQKIDAGDFEGGLNITRQIQKMGTDYYVSYLVSGLLIDIGSALGKQEVVKEGVELLQKDFKKIISNKRYAATAYYNLGNGYFAIYQFKKVKDPYMVCFKETELNNVKECYKKALEYEVKDPRLVSQMLVNFGNCLDQLGRVVEALEFYEKALRYLPNHGMALANKGVALCYYAGLAGAHEEEFVFDAYSLIKEGLKQGVEFHSVAYFKKYLEGIKERFPDKGVLDKPPKFPSCKVKAGSKFEKFLTTFCLENKLYLNICNYCQKCEAAIGDPVVIQEMIIEYEKPRRKDPLKYDPFLRLSAYLNQIKQDYITARFLLVLSKYKGVNLDFVDKKVRIINTLNYTMHNIYVQLVKSSFKSFYDILDKIACLINEYLRLGIAETKIDFRQLWYSDIKKRTVHKKIMDTKNYSLNALFDMSQDFEKGPYKKLRDSRNALTHRFVNVKMFEKAENAENMREQTFFDQTLELAKLVRNAIIYLLQFVHIEERKKKAKLGRITVPMFAQEIPDRLKSYR